MIGGVDVRIRSRAGAGSLNIAVQAIRQMWRKAVFENGVTGERYNQYRDIPFGGLTELFVYRDAGSADAWDDQGAIPELCNTMIHLISDDTQISAVIDQHNQEIDELIASISSALHDNIHWTPAVLLSRAA